MSEPPYFYIYGTPARQVDAHFVHVERVRDRDSLHHGHVQQHRHPHLDQLSLWSRGSGLYTLDGHAIPLPSDALTIVPAGVVHGFEIDGDADAVVISVASGFSSTLVDSHEVFWPSRKRPLLLPLPPDAAAQMRLLFGFVEDECRFASQNSEAALACYLRLILIMTSRLLHLQGERGLLAPENQLLSSFLRLLNEHVRGRWQVNQYVEALGTTPYLLNAATKKAFGETASEVVRRRTVDEAGGLLRFSNCSIAEISFTLGFEDPAHFCRFFRGATGLSPAAWRRQQPNGADDPQSPPWTTAPTGRPSAARADPFGGSRAPSTSS